MTHFSINDFQNSKTKQHKISMLTAYDYFSGNIAENAGIDTILVGDSLGMVVQGKSNTLSVTLDEMIYHAKAVRNGAPGSFIVVDMPYLSYHSNIDETIKNAGKIIQQTNANAVKLEVNNLNTLSHIEALVAAQIPVMGHIGMTPQSVNIFGGFKVQGRTDSQAKQIVDFAKQIEAIGAFAIVLECIPANLAKQITASLMVPTIGIGSGVNCDGQVLVFHDLLGLNSQNIPKFVKQYLNGSELIKNALTKYKSEIQKDQFPELKHSFSE